MRIKKLFVVIAVLAMLLSGLSTPSRVRADWSKVDQLVLDQIDLNGTAEFHVVMAFQADTSAAAALKTRVEKITYVFNLLTQTAEATQAPLLAQLKADGIQYESHYIYNFIAATAGRSTVEWLASRPEVARIVSPPDPRKEPLSENILGNLYGPFLPSENIAASSQSPDGIEWNITRIGAPTVWATGNHGEGMVVGDNDTGVQYNHPALISQYRGNLSGGNFNHNYNWWGGVGNPVPMDWDDSGHGTHTMGTMVGDDGGSNQIGVAPGAEWIACAGIGATDVVTCFEFFLAPWDLDHQNPDPTKAPDSINNSWYDPSPYDYRPIIVNLNAAGIAVIKSAGNYGSGCSTISNPGYVPEIIATAAFGQGDTIAYFSSRGPSSNYGSTILKPEVAAPGVNVRSSVPTNNYTLMSGTSMAAPHSTALVTLMWSAASCIRGDVPLTRQIMMETAESKISAQCPPFVDHPNDVWGWGILDAPTAVAAAVAYCETVVGIEPSVQEKLGELGADVDFAYTVTNSTDVAQDISLSVSGNSWLTELPATTGELPVGESTVITVTVTIPILPQVVIGSDTFTLLAEGALKGEATATGTTLANANVAVEIAAPTGQGAWPMDTLTYEFTVTNTGNYTDAFTLEAGGTWPATLPGGSDTGPLAPGASMTVLVQVEIPSGIVGGTTEITTLTATSQLDESIFSTAEVSTTALYFGILPIMLK
jgi:hypothetical protein